MDWTVDWTRDWTAWGKGEPLHYTPLAQSSGIGIKTEKSLSHFSESSVPFSLQSESKFSDVGKNFVKGSSTHHAPMAGKGAATPHMLVDMVKCW